MTRDSQLIQDEPGLGRIVERIQVVGSLPTIPPIAQHVMALARNEYSSMRQIAEVISQDQVLAAKVLQVVNSAYYALQEKVGTLPLALTILGVREITSLVLGVSIMSAFPATSDNPLFSRTALWRASAQCAFAGRTLAHRVGLGRFGGEAFLGTLVHDIGLIVLDQFCRDEFIDMLEAAQRHHLTPLEAERRYLGTTHASVGAWLAQIWSFPKSLVEAIAFHHSPADSSWDCPLAALVYLADLVFGLHHRGAEVEDAAALIEADEMWRRLMSCPPPVRHPGPITILLDELGEEMRAAPLIIG